MRHLQHPFWHPQFLLLCLSVFLFFSSFHLLVPILPIYCHQLPGVGSAIGMVIASFMVSSLLMRPLVGKLCDEMDKRTLMLIGIGVFAICPLLYLNVQHLPFLYGLRLLHGVSFALFYTASNSLLADIIPAQQKAEGISYFSNAVKLSMAISPGIGLLIVHMHSMNQAFILSSLLAVLTLLCTGFIYIKRPVEKHQPEMVQEHHGKWLNRKGVFPGIVMASNGMVFGALIPFIPLLAMEKHVSHAGLFYTFYAVFLIFSRTLTGRFSDQYGRDAILLPGLILVAGSLVALGWSSHEILFLASAAVYGLSAGTVQPSLMALALDQAAPQERGSVTATFTMLMDLGVALGSYVMGTFGLTYGYAHILFGVALVALIGWCIYLLGRKPIRFFTWEGLPQG